MTCAEPKCEAEATASCEMSLVIFAADGNTRRRALRLMVDLCEAHAAKLQRIAREDMADMDPDWRLERVRRRPVAVGG